MIIIHFPALHKEKYSANCNQKTPLSVGSGVLVRRSQAKRQRYGRINKAEKVVSRDGKRAGWIICLNVVESSVVATGFWISNSLHGEDDTFHRQH